MGDKKRKKKSALLSTLDLLADRGGKNSRRKRRKKEITVGALWNLLVPRCSIKGLKSVPDSGGGERRKFWEKKGGGKRHVELLHFPPFKLLLVSRDRRGYNEEKGREGGGGEIHFVTKKRLQTKQEKRQSP